MSRPAVTNTDERCICGDLEPAHARIHCPVHGLFAGLTREQLRERAGAAEAELSRLREQRDALAEAQQFPVETVMSWKRRVESFEPMIRYARVLLDPERQDEPDEENALRAYEALSGVPLSVEAGLPSAIRQLEAAEAECARLRQALDDREHWTRRMLQALDAYWLHYDGYHGRGAPRSESTGEDWWMRFEKYRARVEALAGPDTPADSPECDHDFVRVYWSPSHHELSYYECEKCGARSSDGIRADSQEDKT